jgi:hypothetical protein
VCVALIQLPDGAIRKAEAHWYEAHGIGKKVCLDNSSYPASLELHKIYRVFGDADAHGNLRIVDDSGEDYLYPAKWFAVVELPRRVRTSLLRRPARLQSA